VTGPGAQSVRLSAHAVVSEFRDGGVLLDLRTKQYLVLNRTGSLVCHRLAAGGSVADLVDALCSQHEVTREMAERDVRALLAELARENLLVPV
jgi:hypothetical protein